MPPVGVRYVLLGSSAVMHLDLLYLADAVGHIVPLYIPWARKAGPYLGMSLWLWPGVLDVIQGVGLGMILPQAR